MTAFCYETVLPHPRREVFAWHARPGALLRLSPRIGGAPQPVAPGPGAALEPGLEVSLRIAVPGSFGHAGVPWRARHDEVEPPDRFSDEMIRGPLGAWRHDHRFEETAEGGTRVVDDIRYRLPGPLDAVPGPWKRLGDRTFEAQLGRLFAYRSRQLRDDLDFHARYSSRRLRIGITGASGLIGTQLTALLSTGGHEVIRFVRGRKAGENEIAWDPARGMLEPDEVASLDAIVNLAGRSISTRFTSRAKAEIRSSRIQGTALLARAIAELPASARPEVLVSGSAIGIYGGERGDEILSEDSALGTGFLAEVCREWESAARPAAQAGVRLVHARTGLVLTPAGGVLAPQLPLIAAGLGPRLGSGRQWQSWISIDDLVSGLAHAVLESAVSGPVNLVAPHPVRQRDFVAAAAAQLRRPSGLPVPLAAPRLALGSEATEQLLAADQRVAPTVLQRTGYVFRHEHITAALAHLLCTRGSPGRRAGP